MIDTGVGTEQVVSTAYAVVQDAATQVTPNIEGVFVTRAQLLEHINILEEARVAPASIPLPVSPLSSLDAPITLDSSIPRMIVNYPDMNAIPSNSPLASSILSQNSPVPSISIPSPTELAAYEQLLSSSD